MKKVMVALAAVAFAAVSQAASVEWNTGTIYAPGAGGTGYAPADAYLPESTTAYSILFTMSASYDSATDSLGTLIKFVSGDSSTTIEDGGYYAGSAKLASDFSSWGEYYGKVVVTEVATGATLSSEVFKFNIAEANEKGEPYIGDGGVDIALANGDELHWKYGAWSTTGWQSVPEPTSGLLLLLGVAGLALRRHRA